MASRVLAVSIRVSPLETLLVDAACAATHLPPIIDDLAARGCAFRADARARAIRPDLPAATEADFDTDWLDAVLNVAVVDGVEGAVAHILRHGSEHTDAIVTEDRSAADAFLAGIDSAIGSIPLAGDLFDFGFRANQRNVALLEARHLTGHSRPGDWLVVAGAGLLLLAGLAIPVVLLVLFLRALS